MLYKSIRKYTVNDPCSFVSMFGLQEWFKQTFDLKCKEVDMEELIEKAIKESDVFKGNDYLVVCNKECEIFVLDGVLTVSDIKPCSP